MVCLGGGRTPIDGRMMRNSAASMLPLMPLVRWLEPPLPGLTQANGFGIASRRIIGAGLTCIPWFLGVVRLESAVVASLGFLRPIMAVVLG